MGISTIWNIFFIAALSQAIFVVFILFLKFFQNRQVHQLILGVFIAIFSFILLNNLVYWNQLQPTYPHFLFSTVSIRFLLPPLFFYYCVSFLSPNFKLKLIDSLHLIPFFLVTLIYFPFLAKTGAEKLAAIAHFGYNESKQFLWIVALIRWSYILQLIAYSVVIYQQIFKYIKQQAPPIDPVRNRQFSWLLLLNSLFLIYGSLMLLYFLLVDWNIGGIEKDFYISAIMCFAIYSISYVGMMNPKLLKGSRVIKKIKVSKYTNNRISETEANRILGLLDKQMTQHQLFLNHNLTLQQIATTLQISRHHISQSLNSILNKSFHQYVNEYRITHAINLLKTKKTGNNLKTIMYASGFNNRASFNNNFKKLTGMTASDFLKKEVLD